MPTTVSHTAQSFPFGEEMVAQHAGGAYTTRYKFNGKELDPQTGYYYYGARYYDPVISRWLNVDPLAEKYPGFSAYNFTLNNPVVYTDPDGRCTLCPKKAKVGDKFNHPFYGVLIYKENGYWEDANGYKMLNDVKIKNPWHIKPLRWLKKLAKVGKTIASAIKHNGGYIAYSYIKKKLYWKPNARGLNFLKGFSTNVKKLFGRAGFVINAALEVYEISNGFKRGAYYGWRQVAGAIGNIGGGLLGSAAATALIGAISTALSFTVAAPIVVVGGIIAGGLLAYYGEQYLQNKYDKIFNYLKND